MLAAFLLEKWRLANRVSQARLARRLDVTQAYVSMILAGKRAPGEQLAADIEEFTNGHVPSTSWPSAEQIRERQSKVKRRSKWVRR